jgi:Uma2 family endonuclease
MIQVLLLYAPLPATNPKIPYIRDMASPTAISVEEYLHTSYRPDCDYVDGEVVERNVGEIKHSLLQVILGAYFRELSRRLPIRVASEQRMRVSFTRFRIPDILVMLKSQRIEPVLTRPPFLCIEIFSPEDRMPRLIERVKEYLDFGVPNVWIIDPETRTGYSYTSEEGLQARDRLATANPEIVVSMPELFSELDEAMQEES